LFPLAFYVGKEVLDFHRQGVFTYFSRVWNVVEVISLFGFAIMIAKWLEYVLSERDVFRSRNVKDFHDLYPIALTYNSTTYVAGFNVIWCGVKLFKYMRFHSRCLLLWDVLAHALRSIIPFAICACLIISGFAWAGTWIFGTRVYVFHTWNLSVGFLLKWIITGPFYTHRGTTHHAYQSMLDAAPTGAGIWSFAWVIVSAVTLINLFIAILINSFQKMSARLRNQEKAESYFEMPPWSLYFASKLAFLSRDFDFKEVLDDMESDARAWRYGLSLVDKDQLRKFLLQLCQEGVYDFEVQDAMQLFPHSDEFASYKSAVAWMRGVSESTGLKMKRTEKLASTERDIEVLTEQVARLEEEILGLVLQLQKVAPAVRCASPI
jgi:hypothetical protein